MRVLVVSHLALPHVGGVENLVDLEIRALTEAGHAVTLVTAVATGAGRSPDYGPAVRIVRVPAWHGLERRFGIPYPLFGPRLLSVLSAEIRRADLVHAHGFLFQNAVAAIVLARVAGVPSVLTDHGGIQTFSSKAATWAARFGAETVGRVSARLADRVVAYNSRVADTLNRLGRRRDAVFLPNPVDRTVFAAPTAGERSAARAALGWHGDKPRVVFVGRLIAAKGVQLLLDAAGPEYDLVFCGPGDVALLGPLPRRGVEYLKPRPQAELRRLYHAANVLALPADVREGFPLVVQEAIASGLPVVLGRDPGFAPYANVPGLVLTDRTVDAVRTAIRSCLARGTITSGNGSTAPTPFFPDLAEWTRRFERIMPQRIEVPRAGT